MPTYQFEAMDSTGAGNQAMSLKRQSEEEGAGYYSADGILHHEDLRQEEAEKPPAETREPRRQEEGPRVRHRWRLVTRQSHHLHTTTLHSTRRRHADLAQLANPWGSEPDREDSKIQPVGRLRRDRGWHRPSQKPWPSRPNAFDRLYVNMVKAGEAGGALEVILRAPRRVPRTRPIAQAESQRRDDLPGRRDLRSPPFVFSPAS